MSQQTKEINWEGIPLLTEDALHQKLAEERWDSISAFLKKHSAGSQVCYNVERLRFPFILSVELKWGTSEWF